MIVHQPTGLYVPTKHEFFMHKQVLEYGFLQKFAPFTAALDLGAQFGFFTWYARIVLGVTEVTAVEALPFNFTYLQKNWSGVYGMRLICSAVHEKSGMVVKLNVSSSSGMSTVMHEVGGDSIDVPTVSLESLCNGKTFDLLKVDIEGAEHLMDWTAVPQSIRAIAMELHMWSDEDRASCHRIVKCLLDQSFRIIRKPRIARSMNYTLAGFVR